MSKVKKIIKAIGIVLLSILILCVLFIIVSLINHKVRSAKEWALLEEKGYINLVEAQDYRLNAPYWGNPEGKHTIVCLSGMGIDNCSLTMRKITIDVEDDNLIICLDRAGYGLSDDTKEDQTCERIVEKYRTALKNGGFEGPYIIMAHSMAGVAEDENQKMGKITEFLYTLSCDFGLDRFFPNVYWSVLPETYTEEEQTIHTALYANSSQTHALISETNNVNDACRTAYDNLKTTDIPKTYIGSSYNFETLDDLKQFIEVYNSDMRRQGKPEDNKTDEQYENMLPGFQDFWQANYVPYIESLGNCEIIAIPSGHLTYQNCPDEVGEVLSDLIEKDEKGE